MSVKRIITHGGQAHADDLLAVAVLLTKFPDAEVHRVSEVPEDIGDAIVVDIGGKYDGEHFFDHHHDPSLPASLILVLRKFFPEINIDEIEELQWISDWDTLGPFKTQLKWGVKLPEFRDPLAEMVLRTFSKAKVIKPDDPLHDMLIAIGIEFLEFLREQSEFLDKAKRAEVFEVKGLKVVRLDENVPIRFVKKVHPGVTIAIQPNQRTPGALTLTRVDDHPRVDFRRILGKVPAHFVHNNGFMAVVDPEFASEAIEQAIE
jgi:hypothetical protein